MLKHTRKETGLDVSDFCFASNHIQLFLGFGGCFWIRYVRQCLCTDLQLALDRF